MNSHDELELLTPYLDEELDASERTRLEVHMTSCAECRTTLAGLQVTIADLRSLPEPVPTPQDSWALRAAIRRARSPMRRWQRVSWAAGAVAAAAIAFAALTLPGGGSRDALESLALAPGSAAVPIYQSGENLTAADAQARLLDVAGIVPGAGSAPAVQTPVHSSGETTYVSKDSAVVTGVSPDSRTAFSLYANADEADPVRAEIDRCVTVVRRSTQEFLEPLRFELATFESKPAFLLFFRATDRYELWVVARSDCNSVLYFGQA